VGGGGVGRVGGVSGWFGGLVWGGGGCGQGEELVWGGDPESVVGGLGDVGWGEISREIWDGLEAVLMEDCGSGGGEDEKSGCSGIGGSDVIGWEPAVRRVELEGLMVFV